MEREECERKILELIKQVCEVYFEYNPSGTYLKIAAMDGTIMFNNAYFAEDWQRPIDAFLNEEGVFTSIEEDCVEPEVEDEQDEI